MNAHAPRKLTRAEMRQRGTTWLWQHPRPETVTAADLVRIGLRPDDAEQVVREAGQSETVEPQRCPSCEGQGRVWRWRIDDQRYPVACPKCAGTGSAVVREAGRGR